MNAALRALVALVISALSMNSVSMRLRGRSLTGKAPGMLKGACLLSNSSMNRYRVIATFIDFLMVFVLLWMADIARNVRSEFTLYSMGFAFMAILMLRGIFGRLAISNEEPELVEKVAKAIAKAMKEEEVEA